MHPGPVYFDNKTKGTPMSDTCKCGHPEVIHGGIFRSGSECGYRACKCKTYRPQSTSQSTSAPVERASERVQSTQN